MTEIEKAFEKYCKCKSNCDLQYVEDCGTIEFAICKDAFKAGASWQREQLDKYKAKELLDEIHTNYMHYHAENYDTKDFVINVAGGSVVVMDKQGYEKLRTVREQLEAEIKELKEINKELLDLNQGFMKMNIKLQAENKTIREQLIKELKPIYDNLNDWIGQQECYASVYTIDDKTFGDLCYIRCLFKAKLDLLEGKK